MMAFVKERSEDLRTEKTFRVTQKNTEEQTGGQQMTRAVGGSNRIPQQMKDMDLQDSDDFTSGSSDNDLTESTSESDSEATPNMTKLQLLYDELDDDDDESGSVSSLDFDNKTSAGMHSLASKTGGTVEEPISSQNTTDGVVISAHQKRDGSKVNKRHYCLYCSKPYAKIARHLEGSHAHESDVAKALGFPKGSKERKKQLDQLRKRGNYAHNSAVMKSGKGELVPSKRPAKESQAKDFIHCLYCQGLFRRKTLWRHIRSCRPQSVPTKPGKTRVQSMCLHPGPVPSNMNEQLWGIISTMNPGPITNIIKKDKFITEIGQHLLDKGGLSAKNKECVRGKMRELARLIHNARKVTSLKTMEDCLNPEKYMETVKAVKYTCGFDSETDTFMIPSLANKLGNSLVKVSKLLKARGLTSNDKELVKNASEFQEVHQKKWNETISATALRNMREAQWNMPSLIPITEDIQKLHLYLNQVHDEWYKSLSESPSTKAWVELAKVCLAQIILLNRRRGGEVPSMPLSAYLSRGSSDPHFHVDWALSEVEKKFCGCFSRIIITGKHERPVPILLTLKMLCALELLVKQREACGVLRDNGYIFARPDAMTHFRGTNCLREFARSCGAKCPKALTSTRMRKHVATLSTLLNMTDTEMEHLANFLGCDTIINSDICRLPEKIQQLAQIGKALITFEQGSLAELRGKILDEIGMDSDEKVLECDEEHRIPMTSGCSSQQVQDAHAFMQNSRGLYPLPPPPAPTGLHPFQMPVGGQKIPRSVSGSNNSSSQQMKDMGLQDFHELCDSESGSTSENDSDASFTPKTTKLQLLYDDDDNFDDESGSMCSLDFENKTSDNMDSLASKPKRTVKRTISNLNTTDGVVISAHQTGDGSKVNKRHYCLYCSKPYVKIARHLEGSHSKKSDVAKALSFPKGSRERKKQLDQLRKRGNYAHNSAVMKSGKGELVPSKRPAKESQAEDFIHCLYCQGLFRRKTLWRHIRSCRPQSVPTKPGKTRVQSMCLHPGPVPSKMNEQLWGIISTMNPGPITDIIKKDKFITEIGEHLLDKGGLSTKNKDYARGKMRELARLIHNARIVTSIKTMEDCLNPKKYMETVKAVKYTCGFDSKTDTFLIPSLANKLGNSLVKVSKLLKARGLTSNDKELVKNASEFQEVHQKKWNETISATALRNMRETQMNMPSLIPITEDIQKLHLYLNQVHDEWYKSLSESPSTKAWVELAKVCLAQIILLNRRRGGEVPSMPLSAYLSRGSSDPHQDVDWALSEVEKKFCGCFSRIIITGTHERPVPILLTLKMLCALELLVKQREACGVLKDNGYIFARPDAMTHFRGTNCLREFARSCGAKCPKALTSTRMRKHVATLSTVLNMTDTEMEHLANFLGYDTIINSDICRLPEKIQHLAQIVKALIGFEQGKSAEQVSGKFLDEIGMDSDEKVLECDDEHRIPMTSGCSSQQVQDSHAFMQNSRGLCPLQPPPSPTGLHPFQMPVGKSCVKRNPWQQSEVQAVERHMKGFIISCTVPAKSDCEKCLQAEPDALRNRDWRNLKFFIYNRITAYKRSMNHMKLPHSGMTV